ncbi:MAG: lipase family protein [Lapillicoccus sp.]
MTGETVYRRVTRRVRALSGPVRPLPRWLRVVVGLVVTALGVVLVVRPLSSLTVLGVYVGISCIVSGVGDLVTRSARDGLRPVVTGVLWTLFGLVVLVWLGRSVNLLGPAVAVLLVVSGAVRVLDLRRGTTSERVLGALFGLAEMAFGGAALLWPDATLLVVALLFGMRCVVFGVSLLWRGVTNRPGRSASARVEATHPSAFRWATGVVLVLVSVATLAVSHQFRQGVPVVDGFYDPPASVPGTPGQLLRQEPYAGDLPDGMTAYRILYTTTADDGVPALASAVVAVPTAAAGKPVPLVAWAHGTNGVARACAPSLGPDAVPYRTITPLGSLVAHGWGVVATDYTGEGTRGSYPYLIGQGEGRSVLDSVRAARQLTTIALAPQTVLWGHSQGGHAALWAGQLAPTYAPELTIAGIAAISPASDPLALAASVARNPGGLGASLGISFVLTAYARTYPDISLDATVTPAARPFVKEAAARCTNDPSTLVTVLTGAALGDDPMLTVDPTTGVFAQRLTQNIPLGPWSAPLFIGQGSADEVVSPAIERAYVDGRCAAGRPLRFVSYPGRTHMGVMAADSPLPADLVQWTDDRFAGRPQTSTCA